MPRLFRILDRTLLGPSLLATVLLCLPPNANTWAAWSGSVPVSPGDSTQLDLAILPDGQGGAFVAWNDRRHPIHMTRVLRLTQEGVVPTAWPAEGMLIEGELDGTRENPRMLSDGEGGIYLTTDGGNIGAGAMMTRISANGAVRNGWPIEIFHSMGYGATHRAVPNEVQGIHASFLPRVFRRPDGNLFLGWSHASRSSDHLHVTWLDPAAQPLPGWGLEGTIVGPWNSGTDEGDFCFDDQDSLYALGWGYLSPGVLGVYFLRDQVKVPVSESNAAPGPAIVPSGEGVLVAWLDRRSGEDRLYAQRYLHDLSVAPGWPAGGIELAPRRSAGGTLRYRVGTPVLAVSMESDGEGGAYVAWVDLEDPDGGDVYLQRLSPDGGVANGWPAGGLLVAGASGEQSLPRLAHAGAGVVVVWQDRRAGDRDVYAQLVGKDGASFWHAGGRPISTGAGDQAAPVVAVGGVFAYVAWEDDRSGVANAHAARVELDRLVSVPIAGARRFALGAPRPNPARDAWRIDLELSAALPARLEVLDLAGRRVVERRIEAAAPGRHRLELHEARGLPAGIYRLRLVQGSRAAVRTAAIVR